MGKSSNLPIWQLELKLCVTSPYAFKLPVFSLLFQPSEKKTFISSLPTLTSHGDVSVMSVEYERLKTNCRSNPFTPLWLEENTTSRVIISAQKMINMARNLSEKLFLRAVSDAYMRRSLSRMICPLFYVFSASFGFREKYFSRLIFIIFFTFYSSAIFFLFIFSIYDLPSDTRMKGEGATFYICCSFLFFRRPFSGATRFKILIIFYYYDCTAVIFAQRPFFSTKSFLEISV